MTLETLEILDIAFTGPRYLTKDQEKKVYKEINSSFITSSKSYWYVGDANGLDNFIVRASKYYQKPLKQFYVEGFEKWHFAKRSKEMIDYVSETENPWLVAFPNKSCPEYCKPSKNPNGGGSGTWLTIAYAIHKGFSVYIFPLENNIEIPDWTARDESIKKENLETAIAGKQLELF
jgi:hypothetical protein